MQFWVTLRAKRAFIDGNDIDFVRSEIAQQPLAQALMASIDPMLPWCMHYWKPNPNAVTFMEQVDCFCSSLQNSEQWQKYRRHVHRSTWESDLIEAPESMFPCWGMFVIFVCFLQPTWKTLTDIPDRLMVYINDARLQAWLSSFHHTTSYSSSLNVE